MTQSGKGCDVADDAIDGSALDPQPLAGPHGFPVDLPSLVGRTHELTHIIHLLKTCRVVTLTGPPGIGKTRLAVEVATRRHPRYPDGAWFVDLAPIGDAELVPLAAAWSLGLDPEPGRSPLDVVCRHLRQRRVLIVLDNCEHLIEACAAFAQRLADDCSGVTVLATSQRRLSIPAEHLEEVAALSLAKPSANPSTASALESQAVRLFCTRAASGTNFRLTDVVVPAVTDICRRLDGIPLAIELAAARVAVLGPGDIAERIEERFRLLTGGRADAPSRHQTLRAAIEWSYDLLSSAEATLLRRLSVFAGSADLSTVEAVCTGGEVPAEAVIDLLMSLVAKSLVVADTGQPRARYHLLETIRAYGRERLSQTADHDDVHRRLIGRYINAGEQSWQQMASGDTRLGVEALEPDHDNIRAAMAWAVDADPGSGLRLAAAMTSFWTARGYFKEGQSWLRRMLTSVEAGNGDADELDLNAPKMMALRARAWWGFGLLSLLQGDVEASRPAAERSLAVAREAALGRAEAQALNLLGFISIFTQDPVAAKPLLEQSVAVARADGDERSLAATLALLGRVHLFVSDVRNAAAAFQECLSLSGGNSSAALIGLASTAVCAGEDARAQELFTQALTLLPNAGDRFEVSLVLSFLGDLAWARGELTEARTALEEGQELARAMGAPYPLVRCLYRLANLAEAEGDLVSARQLASEACEVAERSWLSYALVRALHVAGDLKSRCDDLDGAEEDYVRALSIARSNSDPDGQTGSLRRLATSARERGADDDALSLLHDGITVQTDAGDAQTPTLIEAIAGMGVAQGRPAYAARLFGGAQALRAARGTLRRPDEITRYAADVEHLRSSMDKVAFTTAWAEGAALSRHAIVSLALPGRGARDPNRPKQGWASLTAVERDIVELVAEGMTNKEISDRRLISDRTVQGHLARIFRKLHMTSRRELRDARRELPTTEGDPAAAGAS